MGQLVTFGETPLRLSPPANQRLERAREVRLHADGVESNAAVAAHTLGASAVWLSILPDSPLGRRVCSQVDARGVQTDITWVDPDQHRHALVFGESARPPRESTRLHDREGTAIGAASPGDVPVQRAQESEVLLSGVNSAVLSKDSAESVASLLRAGSVAGATTAVAFEYIPALASPAVYEGVFEELASHADIVFGRESELRRALDLTGRWRDIASHLTVEYELDIAVVFRPGHGAVAMEDSAQVNLAHERAGLEMEPVDTTGEYGALIGGFCEAVLGGDETTTALDAGLAAGALVRSMDGPFLTATDEEFDATLDMLVDDQ